MANNKTKDFSPDYAIRPGETILETMEALGMTQAQLSLRTGLSKKTVNRIITGNEPISSKTSLLFEKVFGVPASFWSNLERNYRDTLARLKEEERLINDIARLKEFPIRQMIKNGWIIKKDSRPQQLEEVLRFYGVASLEQWEEVFNRFKYAARSSTAYERKPGAVSAWIRQGELLAREIKCDPYNAKRFKENLNSIRSLTHKRPEEFRDKLVELCAKAGVAVVFVKEIPNLRLNGITRWLTSKKALIQLNFLNKWGDIFWFTFFHEAGHILKHGKKEVFLEYGNRGDEEKEKEADTFAADLLIQPIKWKRFASGRRYFSKVDIRDFANSIGISLGVVVGRLQHEKRIPEKNCNDLRIKYQWE